MLLLASLAIIVTAAALLALCAGDPKRRRTKRLGESSLGAAMRRGLVAVALMPGVGLLLAGQGAALLIWLGVSALFGWLLTLVFASGADRKGSSTRT